MPRGSTRYHQKNQKNARRRSVGGSFFLLSVDNVKNGRWTTKEKTVKLGCKMVNKYCYTMLQMTVRPWLIVVFHLVSWSVKWSRRVSKTFRIEWYDYCKESWLKELLALEGSCCFSTQRNESYSVLPSLLKKKLAWLVKLDEQVIKIRSIPFNNSKFLLKQ